MSPNGNTQAQASGRSIANEAAFQLTSLCRIYTQGEKVFLLEVTQLVPLWLLEQCKSAEHSQPLLMPVALNSQGANEATIALLQQLNFEINHVAGKFRLQQVPAGTRHLPWLRWFEKLISTTLNNTDDIASSFLIDEDEVDKNTALDVWHWLDQQSDRKQWEMVERFGKVRDLTRVLEFWRGVDG